MSKRTVRLTESELKNIITESVKNILKEEFNSPLPSFAAKEVEPKHRLRKQWDDDYDAMVARNHARGDEFMDSFNKKANLNYSKSLKESLDNRELAYIYKSLRRLSYLIHEEMRPRVDNSTPELLAICKEMAQVVDDALNTDENTYEYSSIPQRNEYFK